MGENLLTVKEVMERLKVSRATLYRFIDQGRLNPLKMGEKAVRFRETDIDAFIQGLSSSAPERVPAKGARGKATS